MPSKSLATGCPLKHMKCTSKPSTLFAKWQFDPCMNSISSSCIHVWYTSWTTYIHPPMPRRLSKGGLDPTKVPDHLQLDRSTSTLASGAQNPGAHPEVGYQATTQGCRSWIWIWRGRWWPRRRGLREWVVHWRWRSSGIKLPPFTLPDTFGMFLIFLICRGMDIIKIWYAYFLLHISPEVPCRLQAVVLQRLAIPWVHSHIGLGIYILYSDYWNFCTGGVFRYYQNLFHINPLYLQKARQFISSPANMVFKLLDGHLQYAYHMQDMPGRTWRTCFAKSGASAGGRAELATLGRILGLWVSTHYHI